MENTTRLKLESILFRNGVHQKELTEVFDLIDSHTRLELCKYDKWCEKCPIEDIKLTSEQLVDKYIKNPNR